MRHFSFFRIIPLSLAVVLSTGMAGMSAIAQSEPEALKSSATAKPAVTLDSLFSELKRTRDEKQAKQISERIWMRWRDSGSATTNLLVQWADKAIADRKNGLALDLLDQAIVLMPDFAEGWNRRATLHYMMGNFGKSMADIDRVLALEPRHFGAIAGMAAILSDSGNDQLELRAWEQMLEIYPANQQAQKKVGELADKLAGSKT
jgi:tetratricopeptide (TPR) repeat protein